MNTRMFAMTMLAALLVMVTLAPSVWAESKLSGDHDHVFANTL